MTNWTTPRTWVADETPDETVMNTHIRDNENHLYENKVYTLIPGLAASPDVAGAGGAGTSEEWGTTTTGLTWSPSSPTTVDSHTTISNHLYVSDTAADGVERFGTKSWAPAGAFDARVGGLYLSSNSSVAATGCVTGIVITDSGNTNRLHIQYNLPLNTQIATLTAYTYTASTYTARGSAISLGVGIPRVYLRITRDGSNNCSFYWSTNGILWQFIATQSFTLTVAKIGFRSVGSAAFQWAADWLRTSV